MSNTYDITEADKPLPQRGGDADEERHFPHFEPDLRPPARGVLGAATPHNHWLVCCHYAYSDANALLHV